MQSKDIILQSINVADMLMGKYLADLDDADLMHRPVDGMHHIAWQMGHLITSERNMIEGLRPGSCPPHAEGFYEKHGKKMAGLDGPENFYTKAEYLEAWATQRAATKALLESMSESDLEAPAPEQIRSMAATVAAVFNLTGLHALMHLGQFVGVRRAKQKPIAF